MYCQSLLVIETFAALLTFVRRLAVMGVLVFLQDKDSLVPFTGTVILWQVVNKLTN